MLPHDMRRRSTAASASATCRPNESRREDNSYKRPKLVEVVVPLRSLLAEQTGALLKPTRCHLRFAGWLTGN